MKGLRRVYVNAGASRKDRARIVEELQRSKVGVEVVVYDLPFFKNAYVHGEEAENISFWKVAESKRLYGEQFRRLSEYLARDTDFYKLTGDTYEGAFERVQFLKGEIENKDG